MRTSALRLFATAILLATSAQAYVIDQTNSPGNSTALNVTSSLEWQQEVRVGISGELVGIGLWSMHTGQVRVSIYRGRAWKSGTPAATLDVDVSTTAGFVNFNFESFHLAFNAGDYFTFSFSGPNGYTQFGGATHGAYPYGDLYANGNNFNPWGLTFVTYMNVPDSPNLVVNVASEGTGFDGRTSLREALAYAQSLGGARTITFDPSLAGQTITLSNGWNDANDANALRISGPITLQGIASFPGLTIAMTNGVAKRHIFVESSGSLTISNLTFTGGNGDYGGSIRSLGSLAIRNCTFTGNHSNNDGGAVHAGVGAPSLLIENSTFSGNSTAAIASAIASGAQQNNYRYLTITNNSGGSGALDVYQYPETMIDSIVAGNNPDGIVALNGGAFTAQSTNNLLGPGGSGGLTNGVNGNLVGMPASQLRLGSLAVLGPTATVPLLPGSPAVDAGVAIAGLTTDQRGENRPQIAAEDIGAFELIPTQAADVPIISPLGGTYENSVQVSIASTSPGAILRYTTDGNEPSDTSGQIYGGPFTLTASATVQAIAYGRGWLDSQIPSVDYTVLPPLPYWRYLQGLAADGSQDLANASGDGVSNLAKYAFNLVPNAGDLTKANYQILTPNGTAGLPLITRDGQGRLVIEFVRRKASSNPGVAYVVETGDELASWSSLSLTNATVVAIDANWERVTVIDPAVSAKHFGRVRLTY